MVIPFIRRRLRSRFGISAPRMTVTTHRPWWERGGTVVALVAAVAAVLWWAFDIGKVSGAARQPIDTHTAALESEAARLRGDASTLRIRNSQLESDLAMTRGVAQTLAQQLADLTAENTKLKEEAIIFQHLASDSGKQAATRRTH
jgi:parvulin-like peptidyl-prolyl isomerase